MTDLSIGEVLELFLSVKGNLNRTVKSIIKLDEAGIIGDKFYGKDLNRSVLLTTVESYNIAKCNDIEMEYGSLGENILIDYNPYQLAIGKRIKIGEVIFEITQNCTICNHLSLIDNSLPLLLKKDRGIFVKVIEEGFLEKGDKIYLL